MVAKNGATEFLPEEVSALPSGQVLIKALAAVPHLFWKVCDRGQRAFCNQGTLLDEGICGRLFCAPRTPRRFKMKKALIISGFLLALSVTGCSTPQAAEPQAPAPAAAPVVQQDDAARRDAERNRDAQRDKDRDRERDQNRDADHDRQARNGPCPDGEHLYTDRDGKTGCVRN